MAAQAQGRLLHLLLLLRLRLEMVVEESQVEERQAAAAPTQVRVRGMAEGTRLGRRGSNSRSQAQVASQVTQACNKGGGQSVVNCPLQLQASDLPPG